MNAADIIKIYKNDIARFSAVSAEDVLAHLTDLRDKQLAEIKKYESMPAEGKTFFDALAPHFSDNCQKKVDDYEAQIAILQAHIADTH